MPSSDYPAVAVVGPTASGKSRLAMSLAARFSGEIVSCDALQMYRGMDVGTAKPTGAERALIPHHMLDLRAPGEDFSAGDYMKLAREKLTSIRDRGNIPLVAGGTGFYLRSLIDGLFEGPSRSDELRARMREIIRRRGPARLHRALSRVDPRSAARISPADPSRIIRAYEVYLLTGKAISRWHEEKPDRLAGFRWLKLGISWPRQELYRRIDLRVEAMFQACFVEEVRNLLASYPRDCHSFKAIGYRQIADCLDGRYSREEALRATQQESRRYAKRQLTWFRGMPDVIWLDASRDWDKLESEAFRLVESHLGCIVAP